MSKVLTPRTFLLYGATGVGKTCCLQSLLDAGLHGIGFDADNQMVARLGKYVKKKALDVVPWKTFEAISAFYARCLTAKTRLYDFVCLDGMSNANESFVRQTETPIEDYLKSRVGSKMKVPDWGDRKPAAEMIYSVLRWGVDLTIPEVVRHPMIVIFTCHEDIRMTGPTSAKPDETLGRVVSRGPALPGRLMLRGGGLIQEMYHMIVVPDEEEKDKAGNALMNRWLVTQNDSEWPAKGSACLDMYEEPDLWAIIQRIEKSQQ